MEVGFGRPRVAEGVPDDALRRGSFGRNCIGAEETEEEGFIGPAVSSAASLVQDSEGAEVIETESCANAVSFGPDSSGGGDFAVPFETEVSVE